MGGEKSAQVFGLFARVCHMEYAAAELLNEAQVLLVCGQSGKCRYEGAFIGTDAFQRGLEELLGQLSGSLSQCPVIPFAFLCFCQLCLYIQFRHTYGYSTLLTTCWQEKSMTCGWVEGITFPASLSGRARGQK